MVLRAGDGQLGEALQETLIRYVVEDDGDHEPNYSLRLSDDPAVFHTLRRGACLAVSSPDPRRVVIALFRHLDGHAERDDGLVPVQATALVRDGEVMLVPTLLEESVRSLSRQLGEEGIVVLDAPVVHLDLDTAELVVGPNLDVDPDSIRDLAALAPSARRAEPPLADGRYSLRRWLFMDYWQPPGPYSRATAARRAALLIRGGPGVAGPDALERLAVLFSTVAAEGIDPSSRQEIRAIARGAR